MWRMRRGRRKKWWLLERIYSKRKLIKFKKEENVLNKQVDRIKNLLKRITKEEYFVIDLYYLNVDKNRKSLF